ncbi:MAG: hypothetical protein AAGH87_04380 [Pseudomonadota bacterium]
MKPEALPDPRRLWIGLALVLALGVLSWRAADRFATAPPTPAGASAAELRLTGLLETVLGANQVRVHQALRADKSQSFLVLLNAQGPGSVFDESRLTSLLNEALAIDPLAGDTVTFEYAAFATGPAVPWPLQAWAELAALFGICASLGGALMTPVSRPPPRVAEPSVRPKAEAGPNLPVDPLPRRLAAQRMAEDPSHAAQIIRRWLALRSLST